MCDGIVAGWQSGYAEDCKSFYIGSIPVPASTAYIIPASSAVEQSAVNRLVVGSNPTAGAILKNLAILCRKAFFIKPSMTINYGRGRMVLRQLRLNRENVIRAFLYLLWCTLIGSLVLFNFEVMWGPTRKGGNCNDLEWQYGMLYNWQAWGRPCIYSAEIYAAAYLSYPLIYLFV